MKRIDTLTLFAVWTVGALTLAYFAAHILAYAINGTRGPYEHRH